MKRAVAIAMRSLVGLVLLLAALAGSPAQAQGSPVQEAAAIDRHDLEAFLDQEMNARLSTGRLAGAVVTVVHRGEVVLAKGYGPADIASGRPMDPALTGIRPGSVSKLVTWTAVMKLAAEGRLQLDADANRYLRGFQIPDDGLGPITLRHLMTHTSGLDGVPFRTLVKLSSSELRPLADSVRESLPPRVRAPGAVAAYSNYGTALAGLIVQEVVGEPFEVYVEREILQPLGMTRSTFIEPLPAEFEARLAKSYFFGQRGLKEAPFEYVHNFSPAGSMTTTADDMARFMIAHLEGGRIGGRQVLPEAALKEMHWRAFGHDPRLPGNALGFYEMTASSRTLLTHKGRTTFVMSQLALLPEERFGVFVSFNAAEGSPPAEAVIRALVKRYFDRPGAHASVSQAPCRQWVGAYRTDWTIERGVDKFVSFGRDITASPAPEGAMQVKEGAGVRTYAQVAPDFFLDAAADEPLAFKEIPGTGRVWMARGNAVAAAYKLTWFETSSFHAWVLGASAAIFAGVLLWTLFALVTRRRERPAAALVLLRLGAGLELLFAGLFAYFMFGPDIAAYNWRLPPYFGAMLMLPAAAAAAWAAGLAVSIVRLRHGGAAVLASPVWILGTAAVAAWTWSLAFWNLIRLWP